jgi:hypothetical protein
VNAVPLVHVPDAVTDTFCPAVAVTPVACHIAVSGALSGGWPTTDRFDAQLAAERDRRRQRRHRHRPALRG